MPLLEMKNYSRYVVQYLSQLLKRHETATLTKDNYIYLFTLIHTKRNLPNDVSNQLSSLSKNLKTLVLARDDGKFGAHFDALLEKYVNSATNATKNDISSTLTSFLAKDVNCYSTWVQSYNKHLQQSNNLLKYIS